MTTKPRKKAATTTLPRATEAEVMAQVEDAFRVLGLTDIHRNNVGGSYHINADGSTRYVAFGEAGDPDWSGQIPAGVTADGRPRPALHVDCEVKRPGERPRPEQIARLIRTNRNGGVGFWVDDGKVALLVLRRVLDGWKVIVDEDGTQWLDDGKD